jgi:hypothetical protein
MDMSPAALVLSLVIGAVGTGLFVYGYKQRRWPQMAGGAILCAYPYFVPNPWMMGAIAVVVCAAVWAAVHSGW